MAHIIPFKGLLYNPEKVSGDDVSAPPYDVITPDYKEILYRKSPYNIVRIDSGKAMAGDTDTSNKYTRARDLLEKWVKEEILVRDDTPALYGYEIDYAFSGERKQLKGILALVKIEELGKGIYPHEETHSKPKADRLNLIKSCFANISPIYSLYNSPDKIASTILSNIHTPPFISAADADGARHSIFKITDKEQIESIAGELYDKPIFIADGHHRYEVALEFKKEMEAKSGPWDFVLMFLANMADEGITILPAHRMIRGLKENDILQKLESDFTISSLPEPAAVLQELSLQGKNVFGLCMGKEQKCFILKYKRDGLSDLPPALKHLDVVVLHELILRRDLGITDIAYEMDINEAVGMVRKGDYDAVFFLNPTGLGDVERVALCNLRMPPKSTYFYPKVLTGLVINSF
ncbi:MAG TPA: DUF1015 domain-containing protein [Dissulfurispiraceae bacterium]|nr:DUF1015 domain-containing protein [Dissulfurispiraceae bacterium]